VVLKVLIDLLGEIFKFNYAKNVKETFITFMAHFEHSRRVIFSRPYFSNSRAFGTVVVCRPSVVVCLSVTDVLWLSVRS